MIRLIQLLCPQRHCIIAAASDSAFETQQTVLEGLENRRRELDLNPWCGLCGSTDLNYEEADTKFPDMKTALPLLREAERENIRAMLLAANLPKNN